MKTYTRVSIQYGSSASLSFSKIILEKYFIYISIFAYSAVPICFPNIHKDYWRFLFVLSLIFIIFFLLLLLLLPVPVAARSKA